MSISKMGIKLWLMGSSKKFVVLGALIAASMWGGWAYYVNLQKSDADQALQAAVVQGLYSGVMTLYMSLSVLFIANKTSTWKWKNIWPVLGTSGHTGLALAIVHFVNHTPALLKTISLPILVSIIWCSILTRKHYSQRV